MDSGREQPRKEIHIEEVKEKLKEARNQNEWWIGWLKDVSKEGNQETRAKLMETGSKEDKQKRLHTIQKKTVTWWPKLLEKKRRKKSAKWISK